MDHGTFRELAAGAALDDLEPAERSALDAHLGACPSCTADARALVDVAGILALAVPGRRPPASLHGAVLAAVAGSEHRPIGIPAAALAYAGAALAPHPPARPIADLPGPAIAAAAPAGEPLDLDGLRRERARYRRLSGAGLAIAAALVVAVGALGVSTASLSDRLEQTAAERDAAVAQLAATDDAMSVVLAPGHATAALSPGPLAGKANVYVVYLPGTQDAWLMAGGLPATPAGSVYQLWTADDVGVHALTTFTCDGTHACLAPFGVDLGHAHATMITLEPAGGAQGAPGPQVAFGELAG